MTSTTRTLAFSRRIRWDRGAARTASSASGHGHLVGAPASATPSPDLPTTGSLICPLLAPSLAFGLMPDSTVSRASGDSQARRSDHEGADAGPQEEADRRVEWLLLTHHIPPEPAYFRVKVRRQLERIGAVALKNSVYVLPVGDDTQEDFEWLKQEIERNGGESTLSVARFLDVATDSRLIAQFREARDGDYEAIAARAAESIARFEKECGEGEPPAQLRSQVARLRRQRAEVGTIDFFGAPGRDAADRTLAVLEGLVRGERPGAATRAPSGHPAGRTWVTREGPKIDRIASAWLIGRFIDPAATFKFVPAKGYRPDRGELRFDMYEGEFTHEGEACTFETLLDHFGLDDPALITVGEIVHDLDCKDEKFGHAETAGIASVIGGVIRLYDRDEERIERGAAVFDELYEYFRGERA